MSPMLMLFVSYHDSFVHNRSLHSFVTIQDRLGDIMRITDIVLPSLFACS